MALKTLGTAATSTLRALVVGTAATPGSGINISNVALINANVKNDQVNGNPIWPGAFQTSGLLYIPNRGVLQCLPGDYIAYDPTNGWPILVSALAAAAAGWVHN